MNEPRWTPGPWRRGIGDGCHTVFDVKQGAIVADRVGTIDGNLIAAAPELYGALQFILAFYEPGQRYLDTEAWKQAEAGARRAMAKACGGTAGETEEVG